MPTRNVTLTPEQDAFHTRLSRNDSREAPVATPVHVIFYRVAQPGAVEIVRVLHERMEPGGPLSRPGL